MLRGPKVSTSSTQLSKPTSLRKHKLIETHIPYIKHSAKKTNNPTKKWEKEITDISTRVRCYILSEKYKTKQWDILSNQWEWHFSRTWETTCAGENVLKNNFYSLLVGMSGSAVWKTVLWFLKLRTQLSYVPVSPLGIYSPKNKTFIQKNIYTLLMAASTCDLHLSEGPDAVPEAKAPPSFTLLTAQQKLDGKTWSSSPSPKSKNKNIEGSKSTNQLSKSSDDD